MSNGFGQANVAQIVDVPADSSVTVGTYTSCIPIVTPCTLAAIPGAGGTLLVEYQIAPDGAWIEWPAGAVATATVYLLTGPVYALKFTATTKDGVVELAQ